MTQPPIEFPVEGLSDESIRLRLRADADTGAMIAACGDPEVQRWTRVPADYDSETAAEWATESARQHETGEGLHLVIADAETDAYLGAIGAQEINPSEGRCAIGYFLARRPAGAAS